MCFHSQQSASAQELKNRFKARFENESHYTPAVYNGFQHPRSPVIANSDPATIRMFHWGLIPNWAKDNTIRKYTLNARLETMHEKPAFKGSVNQRCLVLVDGFFEWQWLDAKGKNKQKYLITMPNNDAFALAGLWSEWTDKTSGEILHSYTIITTEANELMSRIHNSQKRMPLILNRDNENQWISGLPIGKFDVELKAEMV